MAFLENNKEAVLPKRAPGAVQHPSSSSSSCCWRKDAFLWAFVVMGLFLVVFDVYDIKVVVAFDASKSKGGLEADVQAEVGEIVKRQHHSGQPPSSGRSKVVEKREEAAPAAAVSNPDPDPTPSPTKSPIPNPTPKPTTRAPTSAPVPAPTNPPPHVKKEQPKKKNGRNKKRDNNGKHGSDDERAKAQKCLVDRMAKELPQSKELLSKRYGPALQTVIIRDNNLLVILALNEKFAKGPNHWARGKKTVEFYCRNAQGENLGKPTKGGAFQNMIRIKCPLETVRLVGESDQWYEHASLLNYDLTDALECERQSAALFPPMPPPQSTSLVSCTMVDRYNLDIIPQYVEYYRMIGFDQVWFYYNDDWDQAQVDHEGVMRGYFEHPEVREYAAAIPFEYVNSVTGFLYQTPGIHDCIARATQQNITWLFLNDVDEYLQVMRNDTTLREFLEPHEKDCNSGLMIQNWFFGSPKKEKKAHQIKPHPFLLRDYPYRAQKGTSMSQRTKDLVRPNKVNIWNIHTLYTGKSCNSGTKKNTLTPMNGRTELRFNHFKQPYLGAWGTNVLDSTLKDKYAAELEQRLAKVHPAGNYAAKPE